MIERRKEPFQDSGARPLVDLLGYGASEGIYQFHQDEYVKAYCGIADVSVLLWRRYGHAPHRHQPKGTARAKTPLPLLPYSLVRRGPGVLRPGFVGADPPCGQRRLAMTL